jgi:glycosyltransferase involved in cell wall biosynthesis
VWKVLHINDYPIGSQWAHKQGGAEVLMDRTLRLLRGQGVSTDQFTVLDLPDTRLTPRRYVHNPVACQALAAKLREFNPDIAHLHNFYHVLSPGILRELAQFRAARGRLGKPFRVVMTAHDYHLVCPNSGLSWFRPGSPAFHTADVARLTSPAYLSTHCWDPRGWPHSALKCAQHWLNYGLAGRHKVIDLVICPSQFATRLLRRTGQPTIWLPHPGPAVPRARASRPRQLRFVYAGRLVPEKGLAELLDMVPPAFDADWKIVGEGPEKERYLRVLRGKRWQARAQFLGHLSHERTLAAIAASHVLVLPSRWPETYGLTLIEALALGTNILVSNQGAIEELVKAAGAGYVFTLDDAASLRRQLESIQDCLAAGTLNDFDVSKLLRERSEEEYTRRLLAIYAGSERETRLVA